MTDEKLRPATAEQSPLHLAENAQRQPLHQRLATALHIMRRTRLVEADTEEFEAIKAVAETDTEELRTIPAEHEPRSRTKDTHKEPSEREKKAADRRQDYEKKDRQQRALRDFKRQLDR